jgi:hypothetical protein
VNLRIVKRRDGWHRIEQQRWWGGWSYVAWPALLRLELGLFDKWLTADEAEGVARAYRERAESPSTTVVREVR